MLLSIGLWALTLGITTATAMAGDLLRGGYTTSKGGSSSTPGSFTPPSELEARANMVDQLARATKAIEAVGQLQSSARAIAIAAAKNNAGINPNNTSLQLPNVPNGLGVGGLEPVAGATSNSSVWSGATLPTQTTSAGQTVVTVDQDKEDAVLTWTSFNVGSATTLDFNQSKTGASTEDSIVFNVIKNSTGVPSQILGSIKAAGQVYVIDQNGIIFGATSEINVHTLVASSLPINNYLIGVGLVNNPDDQYLFSQLAIPALASNPTAPAFPTPAAPDTPDGKDGSVIVEAGAVLESPADADNVGGRIALVGPNVDNAGTILTPDGETILAAGLQVGFLPHPSSDPSLRGLDVFIGQGGGTATNTGNILSPEGDVTIMGAAVQQNGVIQSTTSVSLNGEINLDADWGTSVVQVNNVNELQTTEAGTVTFGPSSVTDILPEVNSDATITSAEPPPNQSLALTSQVNIQGENIHMEGNASLLAPNATVNMQAGAWDSVGSGQYAFAYTKGQIYLDSGATIDVAGSEDVAASVAQNIVAVQLLGPELADSPLQRNGLLRDQTIYVDIRDQGVYDGTPWIGTPLADAYGYAGLVEYTVGELTTNGGTVSMQAGGSVVMQKGAEVNVSSGWINYTGGVVTTSELISGGNIYPISEATPDLVYSGFLPQFNFDAPKWGVSETYDDPLITGSHYENGYVYGGNGGSITISAPATALEGTLLGLTVNGPRQTGPASVQATPSSLTVAFEGQNPSVTSPLFPVYSPTPPDVVFSTQDDLPAAGAFSLDASGDPAALSTALSSKVVLSPDLFTTNGFGNLTVRDGDGTVTVPAGVELDAGDGGSVTMTAANMNIDGSIVAPGGSINLTVYDYSPYEFTVLNSETDPATPAPNSARGNFVLGSGASLDVAGLVIDDRDGAPDAGTLPEETAGGSVSIDSYNADIEAGSSINVSGGVEETAAGKPAYGAGGSISILAGSDPEIATLLGGRLELEGQLSGYSGSRGGSLTVQSQQIQIGGQAGNGTLLLTPQFFDDGGFGSFTLESLHDLTIAPGTMLDPIAESLLALPYAPGGQGLQTETALLPVNSRTPVSLTLDAEGVADKFAGDPDFGDFVFVGNIVMGAGADISTDPLGSVTLAGDTVSVLGSIDAPGGKITISGQNSSTALGSTNVGTAPVASVYLSPETTLSTAGTTIYTPNNHGYITGSVIPGGSISISGNIVAEAGAVLNVSGASNTLDESPGYTNVSEGLDGVSVSSGLEAVMNGSFEGALLVPTLVESNAGSITLKGQEELFTDATLLGAAGGSEALGGTLTVSSGVFNPNSLTLSPAQVELVVTEAGPTIAGAAPAPGDSVIDHPVTGANTQVTGLQDDGGHIAVSSFGGGGFASINLIASNGAVDFSGPVSISATRSISVGNGGSTSGGGFITGNGAITLAAPFVDLGTGFLPPTPIEQVTAFNPTNAVAPTWGTGSLTVRAQLIDVGNLSLQGIGSLKLIADGGNIQGDGTLDVAGDIQLTAGQIYPPTETTFEIVAYNYTNAKDDAENGTVTIKGSGTQTLPLSAGGTLDIYAADIVQDGVLRAPFGTINLGWDGSGTAPQDPITGAGYISGDSVPITQTVTLGAGSTTSVSAVDPLTGKGITIPYGLILNGVSWIDPSGVDITSVGAPQKAINISGENVTEKHGATIDIRGGGDLFAYQFVSGVDGNVDLLGSPATSWTAKVEYFAGQTVSYNGATYAATATSTGIAPTPGTYWQLIPQAYAIIPGYSVNYAPLRRFQSGPANGFDGTRKPGRRRRIYEQLVNTRRYDLPRWGGRAGRRHLHSAPGPLRDHARGVPGQPAGRDAGRVRLATERRQRGAGLYHRDRPGPGQ
jgi:filamentous hemagglutinin